MSLDTPIKVILTESPSQAQIDQFEAFADLHWGEHDHEGDTELDFFAKPDIVAELYTDSV